MIIQPISPDYSSLGLQHRSVFVDATTHLKEYIKILGKGIPSRGDGVIVRDKDRIIEIGQVSICLIQRHDVPGIGPTLEAFTSERLLERKEIQRWC